MIPATYRPIYRVAGSPAPHPFVVREPQPAGLGDPSVGSMAVGALVSALPGAVIGGLFAKDRLKGAAIGGLISVGISFAISRSLGTV